MWLKFHFFLCFECVYSNMSVLPLTYFSVDDKICWWQIITSFSFFSMIFFRPTANITVWDVVIFGRWFICVCGGFFCFFLFFMFVFFKPHIWRGLEITSSNTNSTCAKTDVNFNFCLCVKRAIHSSFMAFSWYACVIKTYLMWLKDGGQAWWQRVTMQPCQMLAPSETAH